jgi:cathepsin L
MWSKLLAAMGAKHGAELMTSADYQFMQYVSEYGKSYGTKAEFEFRSNIFKQNLEIIAEHNAKPDETHTLGINHTMDWTHEEYKKLLGYKPEMRTGQNEVVELDTSNLAGDVDWRSKGAVTGVKNQGQCGSCWAFSTTGSTEGANQIAHGKLESYSEQQLVDCSKENDACDGGLMDRAFDYIKEDHPLMLEAKYPYTAHKGSCRYEKSEGMGKIRGYKDVRSDDAAQLRAAVMKGPVSIAVEADKSVF